MALSLDALTSQEARPPASARPEPATPPESRLSMPTQSLTRWSRSDGASFAAHGRRPAPPYLKRALVFGGAAILTVWGGREMYEVVSVSRTTVLQYGLLALFIVNFSW